MRRRRAQAIEHHVHIAGNQVLQGRASTPVRNVRDEGLGLQLEQLARQVVRGAATGGAIVQSPGVLFHEIEEGLEVGRLHFFGIDHQHLGHAGHLDQGHQVAFQVIVEAGVHAGRNRVVNRPHEQVVAIRRSLGRNARAQSATGSTPVVNDELLARQLGKLGRHGAGERIGATASRKRHDQIHRFGGPRALGLGPQGQRARQGGHGLQKIAALAPWVQVVHVVSPWFVQRQHHKVFANSALRRGVTEPPTIQSVAPKTPRLP